MHTCFSAVIYDTGLIAFTISEMKLKNHHVELCLSKNQKGISAVINFYDVAC